MKQGVLSTTEHLLAAIYSCGIDNIFIDIDSIEIPIVDGSAEPFVQMLGVVVCANCVSAGGFEGLRHWGR
jgi:UDP-3-O-acyl-N-acetylglucosamine deacetylase